MTDHEQAAERMERELKDMEHRSDEVQADIERAREDWARKQSDDAVPGAQSPEGGLPPEANYTTRGEEPPDDDSEREPWPDE